MITNEKKKIFLVFFLLIALPVYAEEVKIEKSGAMNDLRSFTKSFKANGGYLDLGLRTGYMGGYTSFDLNHHTSELKYPFDVFLWGTAGSLGYERVSLNMEFWWTFFNNPNRGWNMADKDWTESGRLESYTKSKSRMNVFIWDTNLRCDFLVHNCYPKKTEENVSEKLKIKLGGLLGYRYQNYKFKMYGVRQQVNPDPDDDLDKNALVLQYKIRYYLPYIGLVTEIGNDKFGISLSGNYGILPIVRDRDDHVLRDLTTYAKYKKSPMVFLGNAKLYWRFLKDWEANGGVDITLMKIDGKLHEESYNPDWNLDQDLDAQQFIYWIGLAYRF